MPFSIRTMRSSFKTAVIECSWLPLRSNLSRCALRSKVRAAALGSLCASMALMLAACGAAAKQTSAASVPKSERSTPIEVAWNSAPAVSYLPLLMAIHSLQSQGFNIHTETLNGAAAVAEALAGNKAQVSMDNIVGIADAAAKGAPLKVIYDLFRNDVVWVVKKTNLNCSTLNGKPVGIFAPASSSAYTNEMEQYFNRSCPGVSPKLVTIPSSPLRADALLHGEIDGTVLAATDAAVVLAKGQPNEFATVSMSKLLPGIADNYIFANEQVLHQNPGAIEALIKATLASTREMYAHPSVYLAELKKLVSPGDYTVSSAKLLYIRSIFGTPMAVYIMQGLRRVLLRHSNYSNCLGLQRAWSRQSFCGTR